MPNTPSLGSYVDEWWGHYAPARALHVAAQLGAPVDPIALTHATQHLDSQPPSGLEFEPLTPEQHDYILETLDAAQDWLNAWHTSPTLETYWGWQEGYWGHWPHDLGEDIITTRAEALQAILQTQTQHLEYSLDHPDEDPNN